MKLWRRIKKLVLVLLLHLNLSAKDTVCGKCLVKLEKTLRVWSCFLSGRMSHILNVLRIFRKFWVSFKGLIRSKFWYFVVKILHRWYCVTHGGDSLVLLLLISSSLVTAYSSIEKLHEYGPFIVMHEEKRLEKNVSDVQIYFTFLCFLGFLQWICSAYNMKKSK
jgi:hypothetical protein